MGRHRHSCTPFPGWVAAVAATAGVAVVIAGGAWGAGTLREAAPGAPAAVWSSAEPTADAGPEADAPPPATPAGQAPAPALTPGPPPAAQEPPEQAAPVPEDAGTPPLPTPTATGTPERPDPDESRRPPAGDVTASYSTSEVWEDGFQASISLGNSAVVPAHAEVVLVFPAGVRLRGPADCWWDVGCRQAGRTVTLTTTSPLAPGTRRFIGFNAQRPPGSNPFEPVECTVDGAPCEGF